MALKLVSVAFLSALNIEQSMRIASLLALLIVGVSFISAAHLIVTDPVQSTMENGQTLDLGLVGPGQKIVIMAQRPSGELSKNSANPSEALWDRIIPQNIPQGWMAEPSQLYENPFQSFVTVSPTAQDGDYTFDVATFDEYQGVPPITIHAHVRVSRDVLSATLANPQESSGAQQPALYYVTVSNTASASDIFEITTQGLPANWAENQRVFVPHNSAVTVSFPVTPAEGGIYPFSFNMTSLSSSRIHQIVQAELDAQTSIVNDGKAASHGIALFPFIAQPLYSLIAFFSNFH